jgi:hypothetical protein
MAIMNKREKPTSRPVFYNYTILTITIYCGQRKIRPLYVVIGRYLTKSFFGCKIGISNSFSKKFSARPLLRNHYRASIYGNDKHNAGKDE